MADPKFDPSASFDELEEIDEQAPQFDPSAKFDELDEIPAEPKMGKAEAGLRGAEQGLTFGFADELGGAIGAGIEGVAEKPMEGESKMQQLQRLYDEYREFNRARYAEAEEAQPGAFMAGDVAGSLLTPGGIAKTAAKGVAKAGAKQLGKQAVKTGALTGAAEAAGRSEEELLSDEFARDVTLGGAGGALIGKAVSKIGGKLSKEAVEAGAEKAAKDSNIAALKSIGAKAKDIKGELGLKTSTRATADTAKGTGKTLIDEGLIKPKQGIDEVKEGLVAKLDEVATQRLQPAAQQLDELGAQVPLETFAPDYNKFSDKVSGDLEKVIGSAKYAKSGDQAIYKSMSDTKNILMQDIEAAIQSPNKIEELVNIKRQLQNEVNWNDPQANAYNQFLVKMQSNVTGLVNDMSGKISPELAGQMKDANAVYSNLTRANQIAGDELARDLAKESGIGFRDYLAAGVISAVGDNKLLGPAVIGGKKVIEKVTGKDTGKLLNTLEAFQKSRKAKSLTEKAEKYGGLSKSVSEGVDPITGKATQAGAALVDDQKVQEPYNRSKVIGGYIEKSDPETLNAAADKIRTEYGKDGERLANTLQKVSEKDLFGRRALLFSLMQDPNNRRMLGVSEEEE